jgi:PAS domain S-box-containing protein
MRQQNKISVILVNGNKLQTDFIEFLFDKDYFEIKRFDDGQIALEFLISNKDLSAVVVMSYQLKSIDGLQVMNKLNEANKPYAIVFLTADKTVERAIEAMKAGAIDFMPKTSNLEEDLIPMVNKAYNFQQGRLEQEKIKAELDKKNEELAKLSIVASETNNAIAIYNEKFELEWINLAFEKLYGYSKSQYVKNVGKSISDAANSEEIVNEIRKCIDNMSPVSYTSPKTNSKKENIWVHTTLSPVINEENKITKLVSIDTDVTAQKKAEEKIIEQKRKIMDSINYAQSIQTAIIPTKSDFDNYFNDAFIFYLPKDVVSGDFPWMLHHKETTYIATVDCTGHGVPGALLSIIGYFLINHIVDSETEYSTGEILDYLHKSVQTTLKQNERRSYDGMDIALCKFSKNKRSFEYSGAHRPLFILRESKKVETIDGDKKGIGGYFRKRKNQNEKSFTTNNIKFKKGEKIFFCSDGYPDQPNENGRKYTHEQMVEVIEKNPNANMSDYLRIFSTEYVTWQGKAKQIDDVLLIGLEL